MPAVISCSRRTDIPAFYTPWLMNRLRAGYCHTLNPFGGQVYRVSLAPEDVIALAFWTRNPAPLLPHLDELERYGLPYFFNVTLTGYPAVFEPHAAPPENVIRSIQALARRLSPRHIRWRYDPILLSEATPAAFHRKNFTQLAQALAGSTASCTFSFVQFYGKTTRNLGEAARQAGIPLDQPDLPAQQDLAAELAHIAAQHDLCMNTCCNDLLCVDGIQKSHCIDLDVIQSIAPERAKDLKLKPNRPGCGCAASTDIGAYDSCLFGCAYCYATRSLQTARMHHQQHDPQDSLLWRPASLIGKVLAP
jgi:hypothetical protein